MRQWYDLNQLKEIKMDIILVSISYIFKKALIIQGLLPLHGFMARDFEGKKRLSAKGKFSRHDAGWDVQP